MKKVRLFAVAAAMGMFAATVNAAPAKVTKEAYKATWGTMDEIVRAEIGGKVILPTPNVVVTKQGRTTDKTKATATTGSFGTSKYTCYVGLTDEVGKDTNNDGLVDKAVLFAKESGTGKGWYFDDLKFWPTVKTSLYYMGMTGDGYGVRFLKPGSAAEKGWIVSTSHTKYATPEAVLEALEAAGYVKLIKDKEEIVEVITNKKDITNADDEVLASVWTSFKADDSRYGIAELAEDVVSLFDGTVTDVTKLQSAKRTETIAVAYTNSTTPIAYRFKSGTSTYTSVPDQGFLVVSENRYGELVPVGVETSSANVGGIAKPEEGKIAVVLQESATKFTKFATLTTKKSEKGVGLYSMDWNAETGIFEKNSNAGVKYEAGDHSAAITEKITANTFNVNGIYVGGKGLGLYKYDAPANTSDAIVVNYDLGEYGWSLSVSGINTAKGTMTLVDSANKEFTTGAVRIGGKWYPTVANESELLEFVERMAGLYTPEGDSKTAPYKGIYDRLKAGKRYSTITWLDGSKDSEYIPENPLAHYSTQQCTYLVDEAAVPAEQVVVTSNAADVNTNQFGVHDVKLTAKVGETVVGTKDIKVVIAPKYVREYKNGKVTSLKAYQLNGNLYSHTTFDYAKKTSTTIFYAHDGVTAAETQTNAIK